MIPAIGALLWLSLAAAVFTHAPWWLIAALTPPALMWAPGAGWARRVSSDDSTLGQVVDAVWISTLTVFGTVAIVREVSASDAAATLLLLVLPLLVGIAGHLAARNRPPARPIGQGPRLGVAAVVLAALLTFALRPADVLRPLDGHWYLEGADQHEQLSAIAIAPDTGWQATAAVGWPEAGAAVATPASATPTLVARDNTAGTLVLAVRGAIGTQVSTVDAHGKTVQNTVLRSMQEVDAEFPERRYLDAGVAGIAVDVDLQRGETLPLTFDGPALPTAVYLMPTTDAIWALHGTGTLRFTHRWQILNQVENQVWANEMLTTRRFTWNQPPGWSPLLAVPVALTGHDLDAAGVLFLWVIAFVGLCGVRAASLLAPGAPLLAWLAPGGLVAAHGLLMLEPSSHNFPDNLYAASVLSVVAAVARGGDLRFGLQGAATQALRWPGTVVSLIVLGAWAIWFREPVRRRLLHLAAAVGMGGLIAAIAIITGDAEDLAFILYFETFPEHWHDEYSVAELLPRIPHFYGLWTAYSGGALVWCVLAAFGTRNGPRTALRALLSVAFGYSLFLCTVDHHPTHYFLPLVALMGPATVAAAAAVGPTWRGNTLAALHLLGVAALLFENRVW